jgi:YD repeat-containing protein
MGMKYAKGWCRLALSVSVVVGGYCTNAWSQSTVTPEQEYQQLIKVNQDIQPLSDNPFGESVSPYDGSLSFEVTDVSLPGNGPVLELSRSLTTVNALSYALDADRPFGDWDLDIPRIETATANQENDTGWQVANGPTAGRCTYFNVPPTVTSAQNGDPWAPDQWWYGYHLIVPGFGSQELMPRGTVNTLTPQMSSGETFPIVTKQNWMIGCGVTADDGGEGFFAVAPDGTQYTFSHLVYRPMASVESPLGTSPEDATKAESMQPMVAPFNIIARRNAFMYVTEVQDRFGNTLTYNYDPTSGNLTSIVASDGRQINIQYDSSGTLITSVTAVASNVAPRTWTYSYNTTANPDLPSLIGVELPDNKSSWAYNLSELQTAAITTLGGDCSLNKLATLAVNTVTGTITHPSGLTATFNLQAMMHGRSYVPKDCYGTSTSGTDYPYAIFPEVYYQITLTSKSFAGPGVPAETWTYSYSPANQSWSNDPCASNSSCPDEVYTDVVDPNGNDTRYTYSNKFDYTEGQLLSTQYFQGSATSGTLLRTETDTYALPTMGPWPSQMGNDLQQRDNQAQTTELSPLQQRQIAEEGDTYTWQAMAYDAYAHATDVKRYNSISTGQIPIEETTTFLNDPVLWVLGLTQQVNNVTTNEVEVANTYTSNDLLQTRSHFGELLMSYTYNSAGQLASFTDGDGNMTSLQNYYRGIPEQIYYPDGTSEELSVDDFGQITSITDQNNNTTNYTYDPIGRIQQITYPTNDTVSWYPKVFSYSLSPSAERGLAANHWDRTVTVGSAVTTTYFDADLRPVLSDTNNGSQDITVATGYDWTGATTFASYPVYGTPDVTAVTTGTHHSYDALERLIQTQEDSELGSLTTATAYLEGAAQQVTDPNGNVTTTYYQVFDEPEYKDSILVNAPAGITQTITRDIYGNPTAITQSGAYGSENDSVTKTLVYDGYHRLCRTTEPESGSTVMAYDGANNLAWSAQGQNITDGTCGQSDVATAAQTARTYDGMNRVLSITPPAGTQSTNYTYDGVGNLIAVNSGITQQTFDYDTRNLLTNQELSLNSYAWAIAYNYDSYGHVNAIGYPGYGGNSEGIALSPDSLGRVTEVGSYATGITYFPNGEVAGFNYGNGASYAAQQNSRLLLNNFSYGLNGSSNLSETLTYDANGNITNVNDNVNGQRTKSFGYDPLNRLTNATASGLYGAESYSYDALNNLRTRLTGGNTLTLDYDGTNRLVDVEENGSLLTQYGYDAQGNRNSLASGGAATSYTFDAENQLLQVSGVESYAYDAAGRRVLKTDTTGNPTAYYLYDQSGQLMYEFNPATATGTNYVYLGSKLIAKHIMSQLAIPTGITYPATNNGNFTVNWNAVPNATSYTLQEIFPSGTTPTTVYSGSANNASLSGVSAGGHDYQLQACSSSGCGPWADFSVGVWPAIPTITVPSGVQNGTYTVSWTASTGALNYTVQESLNGGAWATIAANTTQISVTRPGTTTGSYTYQVSANNVYGNAGPATSAAVTVNTNYGVVPTTPANLSVPSTSNTGDVTITWSASTPVVTGYILQQSLNNGTWTTVYSGTGTSASLTGLGSGSYTYQLQACNDTAGGSACSGLATAGPLVVTIPPSPAPTLEVQTANSTNGTYIVDWSGNDEATSYTVQEQVNGGAWATVQTGTGTAYDAVNQVNGTYTYRVEACNVGGCSAWSNTATTTVLWPPQSAPSLSGGGSSNTGSYSMSWSSVATATSYTLQESLNSGAWSNVQANSATSWSVSGRGNGSYRYQVQACNASGCGPWSNVITETVALVPSMPADPLQIQVAGTPSKPDVIVNWSAIATATSYTLEVTEPAVSSTPTDYTSSTPGWNHTVLYNGVLQFQLQACNASGCSGLSQPEDVTVTTSGGGCTNVANAVAKQGVAQPQSTPCN